MVSSKHKCTHEFDTYTFYECEDGTLLVICPSCQIPVGSIIPAENGKISDVFIMRPSIMVKHMVEYDDYLGLAF